MKINKKAFNFSHVSNNIFMHYWMKEIFMVNLILSVWFRPETNSVMWELFIPYSIHLHAHDIFLCKFKNIITGRTCYKIYVQKKQKQNWIHTDATVSNKFK